MTKKVLKFGGTSVGSIDRILHAAKIVKKEHDDGNEVIVVVSAMAGTTNNLIAHSESISKKFNKREFDVLLTSGEQVTSALLAGALNDISVKSKSWMNWQIPILTEGEHNNSRIVNMNVTNINNYLSAGGVAIIPGFQGISKLGDITSIGRGGSDATAVVIAKIFETDSCEIYTDVDGVYDKNKKLISEIKSTEAEKLIYDETIKEGMIPKIRTCINALDNGVRGVVIIDGRKPHSILFELFSDKGSGTLIRK